MSETTITPEYAALNAELHVRVASYGARGHRYLDAVLDAMGEHECRDVLDYGCGKGGLAAAIPGIDVAEYDPAIAGKDGTPQPADLVVCTDVLEHVEPDLLAVTLRHIQSLAKRAAFLAISTRPALKTLADGRNAHLIVEPAEWWRARLASLFEIVAEVASDDAYVCVARPLHEIGAIRSVMAVSHDERCRQVEANCAAVSGRLMLQAEPHGRTACLVAFGPSLVDTFVDVMNASDEPGVDIFTVSAAHRYCLDRGVVPMAHLDCDPRAHKVTHLGDAHHAVQYWLASCVHPSFIEWASGGRETALWHAYNGHDSHEHFSSMPAERQHRMVVGGGSIGLRAMSVLYGLGYRHFIIHGLDSSFRGEMQHAGEHHGKRKPVVEVTTPDGRKFVTSPALVLYYRYFFKMLEWMPDATFDLHGDGLLQHAMRLTTHVR